MIFIKLKDQKKRKKVAGSELEFKLQKFLYVSLLNNPGISKEDKMKIYLFFMKFVSRTVSKTRIVRRCTITGRSRVAYRHFAISRSKLKEYLVQGVIPGYYKQSW